ncbi:MAG: aldo/keto reductase [Zoogloeaceae bacterium]|nr:aldo/keto reductase [Zoogloeaceae bacterium]
MNETSFVLNDGRSMPRLGFGTWQMPDEVAPVCVQTALEAGYRLIDTARIYKNEVGVGQGLAAAGLPRESVFLTTKLWNHDQGFDFALAACKASLKRLGQDCVDLYLIHWPMPKKNQYVESWKALIRLREEGRAKSIGVCNFQPEHLQRLIDETGVVPALNQIELHPSFQQRDLRDFHRQHGIVIQSWSPLGQGAELSHPVVQKIAAKHGKSAAQTIIRWHLDSGLSVIPKSATPSRIRENFAVFDFQLDAEDMAAMAALDDPDGRIGWHPNSPDWGA